MTSHLLAYVRGLTAVFIIAVAGCGGGSPAPDPTPRGYVVIDLGENIRAVRMNNKGQIVGTMATDGVHPHAILLENGHVTDLGVLSGNTSAAVDINENGQIVGNAATHDTDFSVHPFLWQNGHIADIAPQDGLQSYAVGINDAGQVAGYTADASGYHAWRWQSDSRIDFLPLSGDNNSQAVAITADGRVAGWSYYTAPCTSGDCTGQIIPHGIIWQNGAPLHILVNRDENTTPSAVNDLGQVVGTTIDSRGFVWKDGGWKHFAQSGLDLDGPAAINNLGQVVGSTYVVNDILFAQRALLYSGGRVIDLNNVILPQAGLFLDRALDINDKGEILAHGTIAGREHSFLLKPQ